VDEQNGANPNFCIFLLSGHLKGKLYPSTVYVNTHEKFDNCRTSFSWCLTTFHQILSKNVERKKVGKFVLTD